MTFKKDGKRKQYKKRGGSATAWGQAAWGSPNEQHAVNAETNVIAINPNVAQYKGGNSIPNPGYTGGDITTMGVPALLIAANQLYKPKRKTFRRKMRGGNVDAVMNQATTIMNKMTPTTMPAVVQSNTNDTPVFSNVEVFGGSGERKLTGAGIFTDIAVPAVLLTANHLYKRKSNKNGRRKRSRRVSFKRQYRR